MWATEHARLLVVKVINRPPAASWSWQKLGFLPSHDNRSCQPWSVEFKIIYPRNFYIIFCTCSQFNMFYLPFALLSYSSCQDSDRCPHSSPPPGAGSAVASEDFWRLIKNRQQQCLGVTWLSGYMFSRYHRNDWHFKSFLNFFLLGYLFVSEI